MYVIFIDAETDKPLAAVRVGGVNGTVQPQTGG
jgi:hypothetical protein